MSTSDLTTCATDDLEKTLRRRIARDQQQWNVPPALRVEAIASRFGVPVEFVIERLKELNAHEAKL